MPELTQAYIREKLQEIDKQIQLKTSEHEKYLFYNGCVKQLLEQAIKSEFKRADSIEGLLKRLLPLNIMQKIIDSLAAIYMEAPLRDVIDGNEADTSLLDRYEDYTMFNVKMREANRHYEMFKKTIAEPYVDSLGYPRLRILPAHTYYAFSSDPVSPEVPDNIWKIVKNDPINGKIIYAVWTKERFLLINQQGNIEHEAMNALNNPDGINPYGALPFVYMVNSSISIEPIPDDTVYSISLAIPIILSDLSFASKYMAWSLIWTVNCNTDIPSGPAAVLHLTANNGDIKPEVNQVKPDVDIEKVLRFVEAVISYLLTSKGLKSNDIVGVLTPETAISGVAKVIDNAELVEQRKDDQANFMAFEKNIWSLISQNMLPVWRKSGKLNPKINEEFSTNFEISIEYKEPTMTVTESEKIDMAVKRLESGLSTLKRELIKLYPDFNEDQINELVEEIQDEKVKSMLRMRAEIEEENGDESQVSA